jgi:hypothetical protein
VRKVPFMTAVWLALLSLTLGSAGCVVPSARAPQVPGPQFGPVYPVAHLGDADPLVAQAVAGDAAPAQAKYRSYMTSSTGSPAVSAEIRGYLVDWVIRKGNMSNIVEAAVMKDGTVYRLAGRLVRPAAGLGMQARPRLTPESVREARARTVAVSFARRWVARAFPQFTSLAPVVYDYLVRIHRADRTSTDVWVDPDVGGGRFFYGIELTKTAG